jgi:WD40 repeat protein
LSCAISPSTALLAAGGLQEKVLAGQRDESALTYVCDRQVLVGNWRTVHVQGKKYPLVPVGEHEGYVSSVCFLHDDRILVSGSGDSNVFVWDLGARVVKCKFTQSADILTVAPHPTVVRRRGPRRIGTLLKALSCARTCMCWPLPAPA